jgi:hypothetical protein
MTDVQAAFWVALTDQRCADLFDAADFISTLSNEGRIFLRSADPGALKALQGVAIRKEVAEFLRDAKPETLTFLREARAEEIEKLAAGIGYVTAFSATGRVMKIGIITLFGAFVGMTIIWDRIAGWLKIGSASK